MFSNPEDKWQMYIIWAVSVITVIVILLQTSVATGFSTYLPFLGYYWPEIFGIVFFIIILAVVVASAGPKSTTEMKSPFAQMLRASGGGYSLNKIFFESPFLRTLFPYRFVDNCGFLF